LENDSMMRYRAVMLSGTLAAALATIACGSSEEGSGGESGDGSGGVGAIFNGTGSTGASGQGSGLPFDECAGEQFGVEGLPLDIYVMQDHTQSMGNDCPLDLNGGPRDNTKWCYATHALAQYFMSDSARGQRAALQFMTVEDYVCNGGQANGESQAAVGLTMLPVDGNHALVTALDTDSPDGGLGTRIEAALHGIADFTLANRTPAREMIGILITDGDPNGCEEDIDVLAGIVHDHLASTGIRTFIIGMTGATLSNLEVLAAAGGAPEHGPEFCGQGRSTCHYWSVGDGDPVAFVDALRQIQNAAAIPCEYIIPPPPPGEGRAAPRRSAPGRARRPPRRARRRSRRAASRQAGPRRRAEAA
jgi:hypothetical protein